MNWRKKNLSICIKSPPYAFFVETNDNFFSRNLRVQADLGVMGNWATGIADYWQDNEGGLIPPPLKEKKYVIYDYDWNSLVCPKNQNDDIWKKNTLM